VLTVLKVQKVLNVRVLKVLSVLMVLAAGTAGAQDAPRGYLQGTVGVARAVETDSSYAGLGAWRVSDRVHVFGELGRMRNVIDPELDDRLAAIGADIRSRTEAQFGTTFPVEFEARVPAWYGLGGVRVAGPSAGRLSTFLEGGLGSARLDPQAHLTVNGDRLDDEVAAIAGFGEDTQQLEFLTGLGGGVAVQAWKRLRVEGAYRYMRLYGDAKTNINRFGVSAGWTF
jgi:opacity protein-like surface antigen